MATSEINDVLLEEWLTKLETAAHWSPRVISRVETVIRTADDYELFRVNPIQYAAEKNMTEGEAIDLFLHASTIGLFEIEWHLVCSTCGHVVKSFRHITHLHPQFNCSNCNVDQNVSMDDYIHVTFTISPRIREISFHKPDTLSIEDFYYKYHLAKGVKLPPDIPFASFDEMIQAMTQEICFIAPGEDRTFTLNVEAGTILIRSIKVNAGAAFVVTDHEHMNEHVIPLKIVGGKLESGEAFQPQVFEAGGFTVRIGVMGELPRGRFVIEVENLAAEKKPFWIIHIPPGSTPFALHFESFLSGKHLLTNQTFRNLYRSEIALNDEGIGIKDITLMFTDLQGSTALYERIGDAQAYFLVRQHFVTLEGIIAKHAGAIVKTIGDAVMASFMTPADAVRAAIEILQRIEEFNQSISEDIILKVGIHRGSSIVVTLNDRLDYFGQTVNIAARIQNLAGKQETYVSDAVYEAPGVKDILAELTVASEAVALKGLSDHFKVYKIVS